MKKLSTFLLILAMGASGFAQQVTPPQDRKMMMEKKEKMHEQHMENMQKELNLSAKQMEEWNRLHLKHKAQIEKQRAEQMAQRKKMMEASKDHQDQMAIELRKILTPEQYQKWELKKKAQMEARKEKRGQGMMKHQHRSSPNKSSMAPMK